MLDWLLGFVGGLLYPLFSIIFVCLDGLQAVFYALAGVGNVSFGAANNVGAGTPITNGNSGADNDTGLIYYLLQNNTVKNMLISIMILALFLIIIFTVMAFIKNAYAAQQKNWKVIVGNAIKGLGNFILLPVICLLGVWLANILLQAINGATSGGGGTQMSRKLFIAAAYNANEFRNDNPDISDENIKKLQDWADGRYYLNSNDTYKGSTIKTGQTAEYYAKIVDDIYATTDVSISGYASVEKWYSLWEVNYLVLIIGGFFMLQALGSIAYSMIKRMFLLIILFVVSPGVCALYPLDEGAAVKSWSGEVKKNILSAHGSVAAINIFFALLPLIDNIHFFGVAGSLASLDDLFQLFILTVGLMSVGEFTGLLSGFIGGHDAFSSGKGQISSAAAKIGKTAVGAAVVGGFIKDHGGKLAKKTWGAAKAGGAMIGKGAKAVGAGLSSVGHDIGGYVGNKIQKGKARRKQNKIDDYLANSNDDNLKNLTNDEVWARMQQEKKDKFDNNGLVKGYRSVRDGINSWNQGRGERKQQRKIDKFAKKNDLEGFDNDFILDQMDYADQVGQAVKQKKKDDRRASRKARIAKAKDAFNNNSVVQSIRSAGSAVKHSAEDSKLGKTASEFVEAGKGLGGELMSTAKAIYEDTGGKDKVEKFTKSLKKSKESQEDRDDKDKKGPGGINKSIDKLAQFLDLNENVKIDAMSSDVIRAIGQVFGEEVGKRLFKGELTKENGKAFDAEDLAKLGLTKYDSMDDVNNLDSIMKKLLSYEKRINSAADEETRKELIKEAIDFTKGADAGSNEALQQALDSALSSFLKAQKGQKVKLDEQAVKALANASNEAAKAMIREMKTNTKSLIDAFFKSQKKDK